jgi:hypothetical protein
MIVTYLQGTPVEEAEIEVVTPIAAERPVEVETPVVETPVVLPSPPPKVATFAVPQTIELPPSPPVIQTAVVCQSLPRFELIDDNKSFRDHNNQHKLKLFWEVHKLPRYQGRNF